MNPIYEQMPTSVFERMSALAIKHGAVNLGQGFPDFGWPDQILDAAAEALKQRSNQYPPSRGLMPLREAVAAHYKRHFGQDLSADQICVTSGATTVERVTRAGRHLKGCSTPERDARHLKGMLDT